jgi:hypothetical protein
MDLSCIHQDETPRSRGDDDGSIAVFLRMIWTQCGLLREKLGKQGLIDRTPEKERKMFTDLLDVHAISSTYGLPLTNKKVTSQIVWFISYCAHVFDHGCITLVLSALEQEESRNDIWVSLKAYLPKELQDEDPQTLLSNELLPFLIQKGIENTLLREEIENTA